MRNAIVVLTTFVLAAAGHGQSIIDGGVVAEVLRNPGMREYPGAKEIVTNPQRHRLQLLVSEILPGAQGPVLRRSGYELGSSYFYPASTIKLFAAASALEQLGELDGVDASSPLTIWGLDDPAGEQQPEVADETNSDGGLITAAHEIRKLFVVSDNRAFNRLYDLVGHERLNTSAREAGLEGVVINHRLAIARTPEQNRSAPRLEIASKNGGTVTIEPRVSPLRFDNAGVPKLEVGAAELVGGERLDRPKSFLYSNRAELVDLQNAVASIVRPELRTGATGYTLADADRAFLIDAMTWLPRECPNPKYDPEDYPDDWAKFMLQGVRDVIPADSIRYVNKIGLAYGFTTDTAYIEDTRTGRAMLVAGAVYTNANATLNDGVYEYNDQAFPFWNALGRSLAQRILLNADGWEHDAVDLQVPMRSGETLGMWVVEPGMPFTHAVLSFNAEVAAAASIRIDVAAPTNDGWSQWMPIADWGVSASEERGPTTWEGGRIAIDELISNDPISKLRIRAVGSQESDEQDPVLRRLDVVVSRRAPGRVLDPVVGERIEALTPFRACEIDGENELASRLCSPTSLSMLLAHRGVEPDYSELIGRVHDGRHDLYGVWPRAIQAAYSYGVPGRLHRFGDWAEVRDHLHRIGPIAISLRAAEGEIRGMDYDASQGHIIVITGLNEAGDALVLDPAFGSEAEARRIYPAHDLSETWLRRARGTAYVLLPDG